MTKQDRKENDRRSSKHNKPINRIRDEINADELDKEIEEATATCERK